MENPYERLETWAENQEFPNSLTIPAPILGFLSPKKVVEMIKEHTPTGEYLASQKMFKRLLPHHLQKNNTSKEYELLSDL